MTTNYGFRMLMDQFFPERKEALLARMANRIRQSLNLQEILDATVVELQAFLQTDRTKVYRFERDGHGQVVAEASTPSRLPSLLGLHYPSDDQERGVGCGVWGFGKDKTTTPQTGTSPYIYV